MGTGWSEWDGIILSFCLFFFPLRAAAFTLLSTSYHFEFIVALLLIPDDSMRLPQLEVWGKGTRRQGLCLNQYL